MLATAFAVWLASCSCSLPYSCPASGVKDVASITFLVSVNDTWYPSEYGKQCLKTVKSPPLQPNRSWNDSVTIHVGNCDYGPLIYTVSSETATGELVGCSLSVITKNNIAFLVWATVWVSTGHGLAKGQLTRRSIESTLRY